MIGIFFKRGHFFLDKDYNCKYAYNRKHDYRRRLKHIKKSDDLKLMWLRNFSIIRHYDSITYMFLKLIEKVVKQAKPVSLNHKQGGGDMIKRILLSTVVLLLMANLSAFAQTDLERTENQMKSAIQTEDQAQRKVETWAADKEDLVSEIRTIQTTNMWLDYQIQKYSIFINRLNQEIALLNTKKLEARKVREGLEPYLENEVLVRLEEYISSDLPFYKAIRAQGVRDAKNTMNDPHSTLAEKLRQVLSVLEIEANYGKEVGTSDVTLIIDGKETEVTILRFGRVAMFYISLDGKKIGRWNDQTKVWEPLPKNYDREINRALQMAKRERTIDLIHIPVGAMK